MPHVPGLCFFTSQERVFCSVVFAVSRQPEDTVPPALGKSPRSKRGHGRHTLAQDIARPACAGLTSVTRWSQRLCGNKWLFRAYNWLRLAATPFLGGVPLICCPVSGLGCYRRGALAPQKARHWQRVGPDFSLFKQLGPPVLLLYNLFLGRVPLPK